MRASGPAPGHARTISITMRIGIGAPPDRVWRQVVDWERLDRWMLEASEFAVVGSQREGVGVEATATVRIAGITTRDRIRVTRWDPPRTLELAHLGWVEGTASMALSRTPTGTDLHWQERLVPPWGALGFIGMWIVRPLMRRVFQRDLRALKELVESGG